LYKEAGNINKKRLGNVPNILNIRLVVCLSLIITLMASPVRADESESGAWEYSVIPFMWAISVRGESAIGAAPPADIDLTFTDVLKNINFGLMGRFEATNGQWKFYGSGLGAILSGDKRKGAAVAIDVDIDTAIVEGGVQYRVGEWPMEVTNMNGLSDRSFTFDVLAGARWSYQNIEIEGMVNPPLPFLPAVPINVSAIEDWIDPFVGVEVVVDISDNWDLIVHQDVGGFGVSSDFTSNTVFGLKRTWKENRKIFIGYRALYTDYETGNGSNLFTYDAWLHGPMVGAYFPF